MAEHDENETEITTTNLTEADTQLADPEPLDDEYEEVNVSESRLEEEYKRLEEEEMEQEEEFALKFLRRAMALKGVFIDRKVFLRTELSKYCPKDVVDAAVDTTPLDAGVSREIMDRVADDAIGIETFKVTGLSAIAGIPGGFAMIATVPADLAQYFAHVIRIEQKLAYAYGWTSFLDDDDEVDDETMTKLILFMGVILGVGSANMALGSFAKNVAQAGIAKTVQKVALTKTAWYPVLKKILNVLGVTLTKKSFAEGVAKAVPVVGGIISGGFTFAAFRPGATNLKKHLRILPQATGVTLTDAELQEAMEKIEAESKIDFAAAFAAAGEAGGNALNAVGEFAGSAASAVGEFGGNALNAAGEFAGNAAGVVSEAGGNALNAAGEFAGSAAKQAGELAAAAQKGAGEAFGAVASGAQGLASGVASFFSRKEEDDKPKPKAKAKAKPKAKPEDVAEEKTKAEPEPEPEPEPKPAPTTAPAADTASKLLELAGLVEKGLLTQEEFEAIKARMLAE